MRVNGGTGVPYRIELHAMRGSLRLWRLLPFGALVFGCTPEAPVEQAEKPPWEWSEAEWRAPLDAVRAGRRNS